MSKQVKTIKIVFENCESVVLDADIFEWFYLDCPGHTVSGRDGYFHELLWTNHVWFILKENIKEVKAPSSRDGILGDWLEDSSLFGRMKYGDITQFHITYDDNETVVYYVDDYEEPSRYGGPNKNQSFEEIDGKLKVMIGKGEQEND